MSSIRAAKLKKTANDDASARPKPKPSAAAKARPLSLLEEIESFRNKSRLKSTLAEPTNAAQKEPPKKPRTLMGDIQGALNNRRKAHRRDSEVRLCKFMHKVTYYFLYWWFADNDKHNCQLGQQ